MTFHSASVRRDPFDESRMTSRFCHGCSIMAHKPIRISNGPQSPSRPLQQICRLQLAPKQPKDRSRSAARPCVTLVPRPSPAASTLASVLSKGRDIGKNAAVFLEQRTCEPGQVQRLFGTFDFATTRDPFCSFCLRLGRPFRVSGSLSLGSGRAASAPPAKRTRGSSDAAHQSPPVGPSLWRWSDRSRRRYPRSGGL
jgi:hypothetical protein